MPKKKKKKKNKFDDVTLQFSMFLMIKYFLDSRHAKIKHSQKFVFAPMDACSL